MCGIVGYLGKKSAKDVIIKGLKRLEYRGYDSTGISTLQNRMFYEALYPHCCIQKYLSDQAS